jgi:hypothetical protein
MRTENNLSLSALAGLLTTSFAPREDGQSDGEASQLQLCCGKKETVMLQACPGARENADPVPFGGRTSPPVTQLSDAVKFGSWLKSL